MRAIQSSSVNVTQLQSLRDDTSEFTFSTGNAYTLDPGTDIFFLKGSPLFIYEERKGPKLGVTIEEVGSLEDIDCRLSFALDSKTGTLNFELFRTRDDGTILIQPAGSVPAGTTEVKITFNAGSADGIVIVGTTDIGSDGKANKKK